MNYEYDLLISHAENEGSQDEQGKEWISNLKSFFEIVLEQLLNRKPRIITSTDLREGELSSMSLPEISGKCSVLVTILSEKYTSSENTFEELRSFIHAAEQTNTLYVSEHSRIFKLLIRSYDENLEPQGIKGLIKYDLSEYNADFLDQVELTAYSSEDDRQFWLKLMDIAYDTYKVMRDLGADQLDAIQTSDQKTLFLAETTPAQARSASMIRREFERHGHRVLPDKPLPKKKAAFDEAMLDYLSRSDLALHIIGEEEGESLEDDNTSVVRAQNSSASEYAERFESSTDKFPRLVWISPDLKFLKEEQKVFIEDFKQDKDNLTGAEIIQTPLEILKTILNNKLKLLDGIKKLKEERKNKGLGAKKVYLITDYKFADQLDPVKSTVESNGFVVSEVSYVKQHDDIISDHRRNLADCDYVVIYYGEENLNWMRMKLIDLAKAPGFGRKKPMDGKILISKVKNPLAGIEMNIPGLNVVETQSDLSPELVTSLISSTQ